ncbi:TatD family hydrolase [Marinicella sediminis]|uniref:TatD family hydrolase n=1 Tax=Marinicella sediminis TaxID=1792834 RepID=A0ABV7J8E4_9GAMM|nr:TatD family hydrolase [Marinicella sediminis]
MTRLIDSHIHLDDDRYASDRAELIKMAQMAGVSQFIVPAVSRKRFATVQQLAMKHESVFHTLGLHPYYIDQHSAEDLEALATALSQPGVIGVGECGLDHFLKNLDRNKQQLVFEAQVVLAKHFKLPLILHVRGAVDDVFNVLKKHDYYHAVMHSFNGSAEQARQITAAGVYLGFGPAVCNPQARKLQTMVQSVPLDRIMLETDGPDQPFYDRYGKRNLPIDLLRVNQELATILNVDAMTLAEQTAANARALFRI